LCRGLRCVGGRREALEGDWRVSKCVVACVRAMSVRAMMACESGGVRAEKGLQTPCLAWAPQVAGCVVGGVVFRSVGAVEGGVGWGGGGEE